VEDDFVDRFEELYGVAYRAAYGVLGNRHEAEECAQESLARLLTRWPRVNTYAAPWVARVSINLAIDRVRADQRAARLRPSEPAERSETDLSDRRRDLAAALVALPRRQREAIVLRYLVDLSERETAGAMGCTVGTVKSTVSRGLDHLRTELGGTWIWDEA